MTAQTVSAPPVIEPVRVLHGHVSQETAYLIEDYPYGRQLRCQMRVWIEGPAASGAKKGQYRVIRQTNDPRSPRFPASWNKPHPGQYSHLLVLVLTAEGHVESRGGGLPYGFRAAQAASLELEGVAAQLAGEDAKLYGLMVKLGQRSHGWESWQQVGAFIRGYYTEHGSWPEIGEARKAGWIDEYDYPVALAAAAAEVGAAA